LAFFNRIVAHLPSSATAPVATVSSSAPMETGDDHDGTDSATGPEYASARMETGPDYVSDARSYGKGQDHEAALANAANAYIEGQKSTQKEEKKSYAKVAAEFDVAETTLKRGVKRVTKGETLKRPGRDTKLTAIEELALVLWILLCARLRFPVTKRMILIKASEIAALSGRPFRKDRPSDKWWKAFKTRHPEVRLRRVKALSKQRSAAATRDMLNTFYADLQWLINTNKLSGDRIFNMDETGLESLGGKSRVAVGPDNDSTAALHEASKHITLIACVNATGTIRMPPTFLFTGVEGRAARTNPLPGCRSGWTYAQTGRCFCLSCDC
jgi:hypothetical protein